MAAARAGVAQSLLHRRHRWSGASGSPIVAVDGGFARDEIVGLYAADYGHLESGSAEGLRVGPASADMYATWLHLRGEQRGTNDWSPRGGRDATIWSAGVIAGRGIGSRQDAGDRRFVVSQPFGCDTTFSEGRGSVSTI